MGNCQTAEAAVLIIQHPDGKVERRYSSITAAQVMGSNPGNYVAVFVPPPPSSVKTTNEKPQRHLKLMQPDGTLQIGHVYRLVAFEDVLKEITAKKHVKMSKLNLSGRSGESGGSRESTAGEVMGGERVESWSGGGWRGGVRGQWRPVLQTIEESSYSHKSDRKN